MEFTIKPAKRKKRGKRGQTTITDCQLAHCLKEPGHCKRLECGQRMKDNIQSLENEKLALVISVDGRIAETRRLAAEVQEECDLEAIGGENITKSFAAFKASVQAMTTANACECPECKEAQLKSELELVTQKLAATQDWLATLREYRSRNDLEHLQRLSGQQTEYFSGGKYFQQVGAYRGHGASAIKPKLQMQSSYNVAALTTNDMVNRSIKRPWGTRQVAKIAIDPGLQGRCAQLADGRTLVHDGTYTTKKGRVITLDESSIATEDSIVSTSGD